MEDYTYDYINGTDIYLYQHKKMFRINTDTALLAQFMKVKKGNGFWISARTTERCFLRHTAMLRHICTASISSRRP